MSGALRASAAPAEPAYTLADTVAHLAPHLAPDLFAAEAVARVLSAARTLPADLSSRFYLERWLRSPAGRVDLIVRVDGSARDRLREPLPLARAWRDDAVLRETVCAVWLEFDLDPSCAAPRVFVDFEPRFAREAPVPERFEAACRAAERITGAPVASRLRSALSRCLERLPPGASLPYLCASPGTAGRLRVCVHRPGADPVALLQAIGWTGDAGSLEADVLRPLAAAGGAPSLMHLDLAPEPAARVGFEYAFARRPQARGGLPGAALLDALVACGGADPHERDALARWPGDSVELLPHAIWLSRVERRLNHVKVTAGGGQPPQAKAYLSVAERLVAGGTVLGGRPTWFGGPP